MSRAAAIRRRAATALLVAACPLLLCLTASRPAWAWGDEGHEVIGRIADYYLTPAARAHVLELLREDAIVTHPGPMVRGVEIASDVADLPVSVITRQVTNGVAVRMAILFLLLGGEWSGADPRA